MKLLMVARLKKLIIYKLSEVKMAKNWKIRTDLSIEVCGHTLFRIECTQDFKEIKAGTLGGYIEKEENLGGDAWVSGDARVYGDAWVSGDARVYGDKITNKDDICYVSNRFYNITITPLHIKIGCQYHAQDAWWNFTDEQIEKMNGQSALNFWKIWKEPLKQICDAMKKEKGEKDVK